MGIPQACSSSFTIQIASSSDGGQTWFNKTGDWQATFTTWAGASGSSAAHGNVFIQNPKKIEETGGLLNRLVRNPACPICSGYNVRNHKGNPIDTLSGNYTYQTVDASIPILGGSLAFERSYSADARDLFTRTLGYGWAHNQDIRLVFPDDPSGIVGQIQLQMPGGSQLPFIEKEDGTFTPYFGVTAQMSRFMVTDNITTYVVTATNQAVYTFNASGLVTQTVSPAGQVITYTYYPTGPLQSVQSSGRFLNFAYDAQDRLARVTDPIDRSTEFEYDAAGDLTVVTDTRGLRWTYQYSGTTHLLMNVVDPDDKSIERTEFDAEGRATRQYDGNNQLVVQLEYGPSGAITVTDGLNHTSIDRYGRGMWLGGSDAAGQPLTRTYDLNFKPTSVADQNGNTTQLTWDTGGSNLQRIVDATGLTTTLSYDALNNPTQTVDARGLATTYRYSGTLLISQTDGLQNTWIYTYGLNHLLIAQQDPLGRVTQYGYDDFGQRTVVTDALGNATRYEYDSIGRLITTTGALSRMTVNAYNNADHLMAVTENYTSTSSEQNYLDTYNRVTHYGYDGFGRQVLVTDTLGRVTRNGYDAAGRLVSTTVNYSPTLGPNAFNQYNLITQYGFDGAGNQTHVTDTLGFVARTEYDSLNRPVTVTTNYQDGMFDPARPDEDVRRVTGYDAAGNAVAQTDALGRITRTWYDKLNRPISVTTNYSPALPQNHNNEYNLVTRYAYDEVGNTLLVTDTLGHVTRNYYDLLGRVVSTTVNYSPTLGVNHHNQYNLTTRYEYDKIGNRVVVTNPLTGTMHYAYDALNRVITTTDALSGQSVTVYDALGNRVKTTDALDHTTVYTYDGANRLAALSDAAGQTTSYAYDALGNTRVVTDARGYPTLSTYDALNRVVMTTDALSGTTALGYDALSRRTVITDANGHPTRTAYDGLGRVLTTTDALGNQTLVGYDALGNRLVVTDANQNTTRYAYDTLNRLITTTDVLSGATSFGYDALGRRTVITDANGHAGRTLYDALGRPITVTDALGDQTLAGYDALGNRVSERDALGHTAVYTYDVLSRRVAQADALGHVTGYRYDALGNRTVMTDANGVVTHYGYDALNQLSAVTESVTTSLGLDPTAYNLTTRYAYDALGNRTVITNARGYTTTFAYDALNRLSAQSDPLSQTTRYGYDPIGNRTVMTDANGAAITYTYDAANRQVRTDYPDSSVTYTYDTVGNRTHLTDTLGTTRYTYDPLYRLTAVVDPFAQPVTYTYDALGNRTNLIYPDGKVVTYTYDLRNRLTTVTDWSSQATLYAYDLADRLMTTTLPNGVRTAYTYDEANRLTRLTHTRAGGYVIVGDYAFVLDALGNRISVTETLRPSEVGGGGSAPELGALPGTTAAEVVLAVTGYRAPGVSALAVVTGTVQPPGVPGASEAVLTPTPGDALSSGLRVTPAPVAQATATPNPTPIEPSATSDVASSDTITDINWLNAVSEGIRRAEYHITWQEQTNLSDRSASYQAPNRAHNLRTYFTVDGIRVMPRDTTAQGGSQAWEKSAAIAYLASDWEWSLSLTSFGYRDNLQPSLTANLSTDENRIDYGRGTFTEWYINDARGLEQGFTLARPPNRGEASHAPLILELALSGDLTPIMIDNGSAIEFATASGLHVLRYGELHAHDTQGRVLPTWMELTASGIRLIVDDTEATYPITLDPLLTSPGWTGEGDQDFAYFGRTVSTAGDVNGDGYSDVIIGADWYDNGESDEGRAYVFLGSATGLSTAAAWSAESNQTSAYFGHWVSTAGDVNGDGYADIIVGAHFYDHDQTDEGQAFVWYGGSSGLGANGTPTNADWSAESNQASAYFGAAAATAGDVNGDGYSDVIVGADGYDNGESNEGRAFAWYGGSGGLGANGTPANADWSAESNQVDGNFGLTLGAAGDVNGDGYADIVIGAWKYDNGESNEGRAYVYHGSSDGLSTSANWTAEANQADAEFAYTVSTAGDVNGDGYADVMVGARLYDSAQADAGRAYVYHGSAAGLSASANWTADGAQGSEYFGHGVGAAGDVNGDGYADVMVAAAGYDGGESNEGRAALYYGSATGLSATAGWTAESNQADAFLVVVGTVGDVNADGYADVMVTAERYDNGESDEGRAWVYHGSPAGLSATAAWTAESDQGSAQFGHSVSTAGDVNGDGYADVIVGARLFDNGQSDEGRAFAYLGSATGLSTTAAWTAESNVANAQFGYAVSTAGDVNGDGFADVVIGASNYGNGQGAEGAAYAYYGSATGLLTTTGWMTESNRGNTNFGSAVGAAGDVNGDGYSDVLIGAHAYDNGQGDEGAVYVYYGSATGLLTTTSWITESNQAGANFGNAVDTAGDVNGDGYSDIVIGSKFYDNGQNDEGRAWVYLGSASGLNANAGWTAESDQAGAQFGHSVSTAGDVNGDGYSDVIVGAIKYDGGNTDEGRVFVYHGSASGLSTTSNWTADSNLNSADFGYAVDTAGDVNGDGYADIIIGAQLYENNGQWDEGWAFVWHGGGSGLGVTGTPTNAGWTAESNQGSANFGFSVGTAGDVNGDGYADVIVGAHRYDNGQADEGRASVYYGNGSDGLEALPRQLRTDGSVHIAPLGRSNSGVKVQLRLTGRSPLGRAPVKLQWQVAPLGVPFTATTLISGTSAAWTDVLTTGVVLTQNVSGLAVDTAYHWRARVLYRPGNRLGQTSSRWLHIPWNGWSETDFRTPYEPVVAHFSGAPLVGAVPLTVTFVNTSTGAASFVWNFGDGQSSTLENPVHVYTATPSATLRGQAGVYTLSIRCLART
ncbi:MAG TPA: FG-GAP-like repeat-containing protein [Anaerolineae bacterium]|nr:FG-GAP-like repeat-containing protein [Anaerolineae bacterium]